LEISHGTTTRRSASSGSSRSTGPASSSVPSFNGPHRGGGQDRLGKRADPEQGVAPIGSAPSAAPPKSIRADFVDVHLVAVGEQGHRQFPGGDPGGHRVVQPAQALGRPRLVIPSVIGAA
jgi:hypothetical protein